MQSPCRRPSNTDGYNIIRENNLFTGSNFDVDVTCEAGEDLRSSMHYWRNRIYIDRMLII